MRHQGASPASCIASIVLLGPLMLLGVGLTGAQTGSAQYAFAVGSGLLCDPGESSNCPAVAKSATGESYEISGAGTFDAQSKSIKAAGTFARRATNGRVLSSGVWIANELVAFNSYGTAPGALPQKGTTGPRQFGSKHLPMASGAMPSGGLAVFRIVFMPMSGATMTAVLQANCALGNVPQERSREGIRLTLERNGGDFSEEASGRVMFLLMRPEAPPSKTP